MRKNSFHNLYYDDLLGQGQHYAPPPQILSYYVYYVAQSTQAVEKRYEKLIDNEVGMVFHEEREIRTNWSEKRFLRYHVRAKQPKATKKKGERAWVVPG